ncbi:MAG: heavy-metal-associated domain-containing protein [Longimicrobiales bacterium]
MTVQTKFIAMALTALAGAGVLCPLCEGGVRVASAQPAAVQQAPDTATVRLHISNMTCGSCPLTARTAFKKLPGVLDARVTLADSLGVVRYDPSRVTPEQIAAHLTHRTGFGATILSDTMETPHRSGGT